MILQEPLLVMLVKLIDRLPPLPHPPRRGRPDCYVEALFLKALVIMIVRRLRTAYELLAVLDQPTAEMQRLRQLLTVGERFPSRRTWERRLNRLPDTLPAQIGALGRALVALIQPWATCGRAVAIDSTTLAARGGVWHKKHREAGVVPDTRIDTESHWTKSGWHGWVYGWKLHVITTVAAVWIPLAAKLTPANAADNEVAPELLGELPGAARFVLGDQAYHAPNVREVCQSAERVLVTPQGGPYPHTDPGVEVRRLFHQLRSHAIENFNEQFKGIFEAHGPLPTRGLRCTQRFVLGAVFLYQLTLWHRFEQRLSLRVGLKAYLKAA
jgi:hypothetical protein